MKRLAKEAMGLFRDEEGAAAVEYAVIVGIVVVGLAAILYMLRDEITRVIGVVVTYLKRIK